MYRRIRDFAFGLWRRIAPLREWALRYTQSQSDVRAQTSAPIHPIRVQPRNAFRTWIDSLQTRLLSRLAPVWGLVTLRRTFVDCRQRPRTARGRPFTARRAGVGVGPLPGCPRPIVGLASGPPLGTGATGASYSLNPRLRSTLWLMVIFIDAR